MPTFVLSTDRATDLDVDVLVLPVFEGPEAGPGVKDVKGIDLLGLYSAAGIEGQTRRIPAGPEHGRRRTEGEGRPVGRCRRARRG